MGWTYFNKPDSSHVSSTDEQKKESANKQSVVFDVDGVAMRISWVEVDPRKLELYSNLVDKKTSTMIREEKGCKTLVNAGFYSKENRHIGLLIATSGLVSSAQENSLFNGILSIDSSGARIISSEPTHVRLAVQTGPIILYEGRPRTLSIKNDEQDRRMLAAITSDGKLIFIAIHREGSEFQGPYLEELPEVIQLFNDSVNIKINNAINLDGGSASAFITDFTNIPERTLIGSYFCEK